MGLLNDIEPAPTGESSSSVPDSRRVIVDDIAPDNLE